MTTTPFQGVVTPEAVVLEFEPAGVGSRGAAAAVDVMIRVAAYLMVATAGAFFTFNGTGLLPDWMVETLFIIVGFLLVFGYSPLFESMWDGRTPGKALFGLRVVTVEGAPINFRHAAIRGALAAFEIIMTFGSVALIAAFVSRRSQRLGDHVAGTLVLRERNALPAPRAVTFNPPSGSEYFAETLDVGALRPDDYANLRSYLIRLPQLHQEARTTLGGQLAAQYASRVNAEVPEAMSPEVFLTCVASAYQRRFAPAPLRY